MKWLAICLLVLSSAAFADERIAVVMSPGTATRLDLSTLKHSFLGTSAELVPIMLPLEHPARRTFDLAILGLEPREVASRWVAERIRGGGVTPLMASSPAQVRRLLASRRDAIGYLPAGEIGDLTVVEVKGGDPQIILAPLPAHVWPEPKAQASLLLRAARYNRNRGDGGLRIGVIFEPSEPQSASAGRAMIVAFTSATSDTPIRVMSVPLLAGQLPPRLPVVDLLYLAPALPQGADAAILARARQEGLLSMASNLKTVELGACLGVTPKDQRLELAVNRGSCQAAGVKLGADLLRVAVLVGEP